MLQAHSFRESRFVRGLLLLFVLATCIRVWVGPISVLDQASAQIPDAGLQRAQTLAEAKRTNELLSDIKHLLETGPLNVRMLGADNQGGAAPTDRAKGS